MDEPEMIVRLTDVWVEETLRQFHADPRPEIPDIPRVTRLMLTEMREPTKAMLRAGAEALNNGPVDIITMWQAMIDTALRAR